jgi:hypothetical protein
MLPQAASEHYRARQRLVLATLALIRREWSQMGDDLDASWATIGPRLALLTSSAQLGAARSSVAYVEAAVGDTAEARLNPRALAGIASDGRSLDGLLYGAVIHARTAKADSLAERLTVGRNWLDRLVQTQVADASRDAIKASVVARPRVSYVRIVNPPCCQRCAVLAGHVYRYSQAFDRHPGCDCSMLPQTVANPDAPGIRIGPEDVKDLTVMQRQAIPDGADFNKVINDYNRAGAYRLPPTRVDKAVTSAGSRKKAAAALAEIGVFT